LLPCALSSSLQPGAGDPAKGLATIDEDEVSQHVHYFASPTLEGRDSPSRGLMLAARYVCEAFAAAGLEAAGDSVECWGEGAWALPGLEGESEPPAWATPPSGSGTYLRPFHATSIRGMDRLAIPVPEQCRLELLVGSEDPVPFSYGEDFVPLPGFTGAASGELAWVGFGIKSRKERYDSLAGLDLKGKVALLLEGEPRHRRAFEGAEVTADASVWNKLVALRAAKAAGAIVVRRPPPRPKWMRADPDPPPLGFRYTWAAWNRPSSDRRRGAGVPAIEISPECAEALLGKDALALAQRLDKSAKPSKVRVRGRRVSFEAVTAAKPFSLPNVVGILPGADPALAAEVVVVGAHLDHIGVGVRGRVGYGADDNASGSACLVELAEALAVARPKRTVLFAAFAGEEDGLLGSAELVRTPPLPLASMVAMVNIDMVGRGDRREVHCLGHRQNPGMEKVVTRARKLARTGIRSVEYCNDAALFRRSDHYSFHRVGIPTIFFFEDYPLEKNSDYHTWRDTPEGVDMEKVTGVARLVFNTAWILADDSERLAAPRN